MSNPLGRRSSFKTPHVEAELRDLVPQDVFKGMQSEYNLSNMTRLSGNSQRGSLQKTRASGIPTPILGRGGTGAYSRNVTIMAPHNDTVASSSRSSRQSKNPAVFSAPRSRNTANPPQPPRNPNLLRSISMSNMHRRKSKSHETLSFLTPAITPARSRSKSPMSTARRRGVHNDGGDIGKSIVVTKEKEILSDMARYVYEFLDSQECASKPAKPTDLINPAKLSAAQIMTMFKFLASHFVGDIFFQQPEKKDKGKKVEKVEDDINKIMEALKVLRYPGTLPKTHFKTPNASFAWPGCLTALAWLCCRTEMLISPPSEPTIAQLSKAGLQEHAFESYLNLFPFYFKNDLSANEIDAELENFKTRVRESDAIDLTKTKDELIQERKEKLAELESLNKEVNPTKEVKDRWKAEVAVLTSLHQKVDKTMNSCKQYSNVQRLKLQQEGIELSIKSKAAELLRLKQLITGQSLNKLKASDLSKETATLVQQLSSIHHVNIKLKEELERRSQQLKTYQHQLSEKCKSFGIVERFNEHARFLKLEEYTISPNPFSPRELEEWMKGIANTLRKSHDRVNHVIREVTLSSEQRTQEYQGFVDKDNKLDTAIKDFSLKNLQVDKYKDFNANELDQKEADTRSLLDDVNAELRTHKENLKNAHDMMDDANKTLLAWKESVVDYENCKNKWKNTVDIEFGKLHLYVCEIKQTFKEMITTAAQTQQIFYLEHYGVDIFEAHDFGEPEGIPVGESGETEDE